MWRANSALLVPPGAAPCDCRRSFSAGVAKAFAVSAWMRLTMSIGVTAGASRPNHELASWPFSAGPPASSIVGSPGSAGARCALLGGPKGMEPALVQRIHDAFKQAMEAPSHVEALAKYDQQLMPMSPSQYTRFAEDTFRREKALVDKLGLAKPS